MYMTYRATAVILLKYTHLARVMTAAVEILISTLSADIATPWAAWRAGVKRSSARGVYRGRESSTFRARPRADAFSLRVETPGPDDVCLSRGHCSSAPGR